MNACLHRECALKFTVGREKFLKKILTRARNFRVYITFYTEFSSRNQNEILDRSSNYFEILNVLFILVLFQNLYSGSAVQWYSFNQILPGFYILTQKIRYFYIMFYAKIDRTIEYYKIPIIHIFIKLIIQGLLAFQTIIGFPHQVPGSIPAETDILNFYLGFCFYIFI